jgi:hypothetical protein
MREIRVRVLAQSEGIVVKYVSRGGQLVSPRSAAGTAGKTYLPCAIDVLVQGRAQLLHGPVKFLFISNCNRRFNQIPDPVIARHFTTPAGNHFPTFITD